MKRISLTTIKSFVWRMAFILLMLVMVSSHFSFRYAAKYTTSSTGTDTGRVAKFSVEITDTENLRSQYIQISSMKPGDVINYEITLSNTSEVALQCVISATNVTENLPLTMDTVTTALAIGATETTTFTIQWKNDEDNITNTSPDYAGKVDLIKLTVSVVQVD